jgi:acyl-CoA synthetase (AMP-forming)/AMP-acid ligase II
VPIQVQRELVHRLTVAHARLRGRLRRVGSALGRWYLHTDDIALITPDGYIRVTDRMKDVIKSGGEWISSLQIEELIAQYPGVKEVAVIGIPDEKWGNGLWRLLSRTPIAPVAFAKPT